MPKVDMSKGVYYNSRGRITRLVNRVRRHISENPELIYFVKIPKTRKGRSGIQYRGYYWPDNERIDIDYRYEIIPTLIHECIHHFHEDWSESKVEREERMIMATLSKKQAIKLLKTLVSIFP